MLDEDRDGARGDGCAVPTEAPATWRAVLAVRRAVDAGDAPSLTGDPAPGAAARGATGRPSPNAAALPDLLLGLALTSRKHGFVLGVLGQTLDGYIATPAGESRGLNGPAGLAYLHRLRALSDAVLVGAATAVLDRPRLTTRLAEGPNPTRVVIDPNGRLPPDSPLLRDGEAPTVVVRAGEEAAGDERLTDQARVVRVPPEDGELPPARVLGALRARGLARVLVEGGGDTVSRFLAAGALDRLQLLVAPVLLGAGRPAVRLRRPPGRLADAPRPPGAQHLLGDGDVLFDLRLRAR